MAQADARYDQLLEVMCYETAGMIFVLLEGDDIEGKVKELMGSSLSDIANFDIERSNTSTVERLELDCNYVFSDGFAETYHIGPLHKTPSVPTIIQTPP